MYVCFQKENADVWAIKAKKQYCILKGLNIYIELLKVEKGESFYAARRVVLYNGYISESRVKIFRATLNDRYYVADHAFLMLLLSRIVVLYFTMLFIQKATLLLCT